MHKIVSSLQNAIRQALDKNINIELIVAYSGGVDSQVLLHALAQLKKNKLLSNAVTVCHVNHGLSDNALYWQDFAKQECAKLAFKLIVKTVNVQAKAQASLEALARDARYDALKSLSDNKLIVLTGHHSDDQTETFLLALKRGAGLKGLSAMAEHTPLEQHLLLRPLLNISRQEIVDYAIEHQLDWVEDESNQDTRYDRNFIRQTIMPIMRERWPGINKTINRSASHCLAGQELLDELAEQDLKQSKASETSLFVSVLNTLSSARFNNLIRYFLAIHNCLMPSTQQVKQLKNQLHANDDKTPAVKVGEHYFRRFKGAIYLTRDFKELKDWQANVNFLNEVNKLILPDLLGELVFSQLTSHEEFVQKSYIKKEDIILKDNTITSICLPKGNQQVTIRYRHDNPKCLPEYRQHSRSVKKILQELNITPWERKRIAFLYYGDELVSAIGYFVCQPFIAQSNQPRILIHWAK
jgi:tRNA(Ile)-lysidine synthase